MTTETIGSAVKFLRRLPKNMEGYDSDKKLVVVNMHILADRIEAAHKREMEAIARFINKEGCAK